MKKIIRTLVFFTITALAFSGLSFGSEKDDLWLIIPGVKAGPITPQTSEADLIKTYGRQNVTNEDLCLDAECSKTEIGTVLYPKDPLRNIKIYWKEPSKKRFPKSLDLMGDKSYWKLANGISLGTTLRELLKINQNKISFFGFGWDAGGCLTSWNKGNIEKKYSGLVSICLTEGRSLTKEEAHGVVGDRELNSDNKVIQKINPIVHQISVNFK